MGKEAPFLFGRGLMAVVFVLVIAVLVLMRGEAPRTEFQRYEGPLAYVSKVPMGKGADASDGKHYHLAFQGLPRLFEVFVGRDPGDFAPEFENLDKLHLGDTIELYYEENFSSRGNPINRLVYFVDRDGENLFRRGSSDLGMGLVMIALAIALFILLLILKRRGRIA